MKKIKSGIIKYLSRSFLYVGGFLEGQCFKKIIELWFKQLEWISFVAILIFAGFKTEEVIIANLFFFMGALSIIFVFVYSRHSLNEILDAFLVDINKTNKILGLKEYETSGNIYTVTILSVAMLANFLEILSSFYILSIFL